MKKILVMAAAISLLYSCNAKYSKDSIEVEEVVQIAQEDVHNAENSLDVNGKYTGVIPAANNTGIATVIVLGDNNTYTKASAIVSSSSGNTVKTEGKYEWNSEGNTITLLGDKKPNRYFVGENRLFPLDADGNRMIDDSADRCVLIKIQE